MSLCEMTITDALKGLHERKFSSYELVKSCLEKIDDFDPRLNAYISVFAEEALKQAETADKIFSDTVAHNFPLLLGIPLALKDNILVYNTKTTAGSKILANYIASYDAGVVKRLKKQGAVFLGKTNMDEFAMGSSTENSAYGPSRNPCDYERVPGGSSGGSAAAVKAHLCLGALGSDTGGSIRQPASFCGIVGMKPTYGAVSRYGLIAMASSLDQIGPMAKCVKDAKIIFEAIAGKDDFDATSIEPGKDANSQFADLQGVKIGVPQEYFAKGLDKDVEEAIKAVLKKLERAGAELEQISLAHSKYALPTYYIVVPCEVSANLARFDGIRYGYSSASAENLREVYTKSRGEGFGSEVKRRIMIGTYALSAGYYDAYYLKAQRVRRLIFNDFKKAFERVDFIIGPTTPSPAFRLGERVDDPLSMYLADIYTVAINLAGLPGISIPVGVVRREDKDLPVGMQIISPWFSDIKLFGMAEKLESLLEDK